MESQTQNVFAGFKLPRTECGPTLLRPDACPAMGRTYLAKRLKAFKSGGRGCIGRVTYPDCIRTRDTARSFSGWGTYQEKGDILGLRWSYADEVPSDWGNDGDVIPDLDHQGYYTDELGGDTVRGVVLKLPRQRGYLYGWSMGEGMATSICSDVVQDLARAIHSADQEADNVAESEREYRSGGEEELED